MGFQIPISVMDNGMLICQKYYPTTYNSEELEDIIETTA